MSEPLDPGEQAEAHYIAATNLARLRAAQVILGQMIPRPISGTLQRRVQSALHDWIELEDKAAELAATLLRR